MQNDLIKNEISKFVSQDVDILIPKNTNFGDYSINKNRLSKEINIEEIRSDYFERIEEKAGFINFYISKKYLINRLSQSSLSKIENRTKYLVEFGQPNTHKLPHIGHLFSYIYGQSVSLLLESQGNDVRRLNYQGDLGLHVAKCLYIVNEKIDEIARLDTLENKINFLQECYQLGSKIYEIDDDVKVKINKLNTDIYHSDAKVMSLWNQTREWSLAYYSLFENKLGIKYDRSYFESETYTIGKEIVEKNIPNIFERSEGAIIFNGENYKVHTRVFINSQGNPTYEAKDIGLMQQKIKDFEFDKCIVTTANEQNDYWKVIEKVSGLIFPTIEGKIIHLGFGMISLKGQKMSSREGKILSAFDLIDEVTAKILEKFPDTNNDVVLNLALSSIKYSLLKSEAKKNVIFDMDESISLTGNSGIYIQYMHARCSSLLRGIDVENLKIDEAYELSKIELDIIRHLFHYGNTLESASRLFAPHIICNYLFELTKLYSSYYEQTPILKANEIEKNSRLFITKCVKDKIATMLTLLGISPLSKI